MGAMCLPPLGSPYATLGSSTERNNVTVCQFVACIDLDSECDGQAEFL